MFAELGEFTEVEPDALLRLPPCPIPRPGEDVTWFADSRPVKGVLTGFTSDGCPLIVNEFGNGVKKGSFQEIRLVDPFQRVGPNWSSLPRTCLRRPPQQVIRAFESLLDQRIPPGPKYIDLVDAIWSRGFEVFVVGGTVRDVVASAISKDIDLVTTMPLSMCYGFVPSMYRYKPTHAIERGFIRIGGQPESGDPFIDLKCFSDSLPGTREATFGVGFDRDIAHRDFACNALYYDPVNKVLLDPSGNGLNDSLSKQLRLICTSKDPFQHAQIFIRLFKFCARGFRPTPDTIARLVELAGAVRTMKRSIRVRYTRTQIISKCARQDDHAVALDSFRSEMLNYGAGDTWTEHFEPLVNEILK